MATDEIREKAPAATIEAGPSVQLPTGFGNFTAQAWTDAATGVEHLSITSPVRPAAEPLVRLHSECLTGDVFASYRCDCGEQLEQALALIGEQGGTVLYLRGQEGRGIGLANKMRAYALQEAGADTVEANEQLGLPVDARDYSAAAAILRAMGIGAIRLLSNNPAKSVTLAALGIEVVEMVTAEVPFREQNRRYLETKRDRMDHRLAVLQTTPVQQS